MPFRIINIFFMLLPFIICQLKAEAPLETSNGKGSRRLYLAHITRGSWNRRLIIAGVIKNSSYIIGRRMLAWWCALQRNLQVTIPREQARRSVRPGSQACQDIVRAPRKYGGKKRGGQKLLLWSARWCAFWGKANILVTSNRNKRLRSDNFVAGRARCLYSLTSQKASGGLYTDRKNNSLLSQWLTIKVFLIKQNAHTSVFSPLLQGQPGCELISKSKQCLADTGGWARREWRFSRTADFLPRVSFGQEEGAPGTTVNTVAAWWFSSPSLGSYFLCKTTVILMGRHLFIKVIWEFSQHMDNKIGPCIMFRILPFNKTFYKLSAYLLTNKCPSRGPAAYAMVCGALAAIGKF